MIRTLTPLLAALLLASAPMAHAAQQAEAAAPAAGDEIKVVYHINDASVARAAMNNVNNELNASPSDKIVVVTHGKGIDFLLNDAKDDKGAFEPQVAALKNRGVDFRVCNNTLQRRKIDPKGLVSDVKIVPAGVAEIARLQAKEGFAYIKP